MSAFVCGNDHIDALMNFAVLKMVSFWNQDTHERTTITRSNAEEIGQILVDENVRSVNYRYNDQEQPYKFKFNLLPHVHYKPIQIIKACHCLDYQSCETPDWETTLAWRIVLELQCAATHSLPGYEAAKWEIRGTQLQPA